MTRPVLIDTDPGCDDAVALLLTLERDDLEVVGVTTAHGNATVADATTNARAILELVDRTGVPIAAGADRPLNVALETAEHIHGEGGIRGVLPEPTPATEPADIHAARFIVEQARAHEGDLVLAALAPNKCGARPRARTRPPRTARRTDRHGGAAFAQGNVTPLAEANFHSDPHAAFRVVRDFEPTIVGLDVTTRATLPPSRLESLSTDDPLGRSIREWLTYYDRERLERYGIESAALHDALPIAALVDGDVLETASYPLRVGTDGDLARGALVADAHGVTGRSATGTVAVDADYERFRAILAASLERYLTLADVETG